MIVQELIEKLQSLPKDAIVVCFDGEMVTGYGVDKVSLVPDKDRHYFSQFPNNIPLVEID